MRRVLPVLLLALSALVTVGCSHTPVTPVVPPPPPVIKDWTITFKWSYDYTNNFVCSSTVTKGCINGFTLGYLQGTTPVPLTTVPNTACTGTTQPEACTAVVNSQLPIGTLTFYGVANYVDNNGTAGTSPQDTTAPDVIAAGAMTGLTEAHQ